MLVLSRKRGESVVIGERVTVTVLEVRGDRVKLGFAAPAETPIYREEIHTRMEGRLVVAGPSSGRLPLGSADSRLAAEHRAS